MLVYIKTFFSLLNIILPSILAVVNILFISRMCNTIIAQNLVIIDSIAASKEQTAAKIIEIPTGTVAIPSEPSFLSVISPYIAVIGSIAVFGVFIYFYYTSGGKGPTPDLPSISIKKTEDAIVSKIEQSSTQILSKMTEKAHENEASDKFIQSSFDFLVENVTTVSQKVETNNTKISELILSLNDINNDRSVIDSDINSAISLTQKAVDSTVAAVNTNFDNILLLQKQTKACEGSIIVLRNDIQSINASQVTKDFGTNLNQKMSTLTQKLDLVIKQENPMRGMQDHMSRLTKGISENHKDIVSLREITTINSNTINANSVDINTLKSSQESILSNQTNLSAQIVEVKELIVNFINSQG